ncbi:MAG: hypothetical protein JXB39_04545 [Deltaproteobacteria bacterium]|nr:hypothetical protein [Deltaproteobacteria bacterium]
MSTHRSNRHSCLFCFVLFMVVNSFSIVIAHAVSEESEPSDEAAVIGETDAAYRAALEACYSEAEYVDGVEVDPCQSILDAYAEWVASLYDEMSVEDVFETETYPLPRIWYVSTTGTNNPACGPSFNPCQTIQWVEQIPFLCDGDVIHIIAGVYTGIGNRIKAWGHSDLTYDGEGPGLTILDGDDTGDTGLDGDETAFPSWRGWVDVYDVDGTKIRDLEVRDIEATGDLGIGIAARCDGGATGEEDEGCYGLLIENVTVENTNGSGIYVHADPAQDAWWLDVDVQGAYVEDACTGGENPPPNECITIERVRGFGVTGNTVVNCHKESIERPPSPA